MQLQTLKSWYYVCVQSYTQVCSSFRSEVYFNFDTQQVFMCVIMLQTVPLASMQTFTNFHDCVVFFLVNIFSLKLMRNSPLPVIWTKGRSTVFKGHCHLRSASTFFTSYGKLTVFLEMWSVIISQTCQL